MWSSTFLTALSPARRALTCADPYVSKWGASFFLIDSQVKTTASAVKELPSWNFTFRRSLNTHLVGWSLRTSHDSASPGTSGAGRSLRVRSHAIKGS